ncbi:MAG: DUF1007 family protein [Hyphomicrobiaceae bacterium]
MRRFIWLITLSSAFAAVAFLSRSPADAHPHVQIKVETAVIVEHGAAIGFRHRWTFDKAYLASVLEEFDGDGDRKLDASERAKLLAHTRDTLKRFGSFTVAWAKAGKLKLKPAEEIRMTFEHDVPVLQFSINLAKPTALAANGFRFEVYDATYFSAFRFAGASAVWFAGPAPSDCTLTIKRPDEGEQLMAYRRFIKEFGPMAAALVAPAMVVAMCPEQDKPAGTTE